MEPPAGLLVQNYVICVEPQAFKLAGSQTTLGSWMIRMAARPPPSCAVDGCASGIPTFHNLPKERQCQHAWLMFLYKRIPPHFNQRLVVCSAHFTSDCFANSGQFQGGFAQRLVLNRGAVPTLSPPQPQQHVHTVSIKPCY